MHKFLSVSSLLIVFIVFVATSAESQYRPETQALSKTESKAQVTAASAEKPTLAFPNCTQAQFNSTGSKLFYSCQLKERHSQFQIYERDLEANTERRISFNDGDSLFPLPYRDQLYFFSTTDNNKRLSFQTEKSVAQLDLFAMNLKSKDITAMTGQNIIRSSPQLSPFSLYWNEKAENQIQWFSLDLETQKIRQLKIPSTLVVKDLVQIGKQEWLLISTNEILKWNEKNSKITESKLQAESENMRPIFFSHNQDGAIIRLKTPIKLANSETASDLIWISSRDSCAVKLDGLPKETRYVSLNPSNPEQVALTLVQDDSTRVEVKSLKMDLGTCGSIQISSKLEK